MESTQKGISGSIVKHKFKSLLKFQNRKVFHILTGYTKYVYKDHTIMILFV